MRPGEEGIAGLVPVAEIVAVAKEMDTGSEVNRPFAATICSPLSDEDRAFLAGRFGRTAQDAEFGFPVFPDIDPIQSLFHEV